MANVERTGGSAPEPPPQDADANQRPAPAPAKAGDPPADDPDFYFWGINEFYVAP
jgi:hypothetical protein